MELRNAPWSAEEGRAPAPFDRLSLPASVSRRQILRVLAGAGLVSFIPFGRRGTARWGGDAEAGTTEWASGGTAAMTAKDTYPDPFDAEIGPCLLVATTTQGPCTTETDIVREDISEAWTGLPVRLALKVVDESCNPLVGATIKIWHTNIEGSYSGPTPNNGICLKDQAYASANFFRGVQTTAADGTVFFDTCFPGWYRGRAIHIHFQVKDASRTYRVSQLFFPEDVTEDIFANHPEYSPYGQPDTTFADDGIVAGIPAAERDRLILTIARMSDGAMLASQVVAVVDSAPVSTPTTTPAGATATPTPSTTPDTAACAGDCDGGDSVTVDELLKGVNIALDSAEPSSCGAFDTNADGRVTVDEIIAAVNAALSGCS